MAFLDRVKPIKVQVTGSRMSPDEKCRAKMIALLRKQVAPKKGKRSWFLTIGDQEVFVPRYANVNLVPAHERRQEECLPRLQDTADDPANVHRGCARGRA